MNNKFRKLITFTFLFFFSLVFSSIALAQTGLEVNYPGFLPSANKNILPEYIKYIYEFIIIGAGATALWYLIEGGIRYLTSAGKPENLESAKKQILATFWGTIILLSSYIILTTINPNLIILNLPNLTKAPAPPLPETPISPKEETTDLLVRVKELAETIKKIPDEIKNIAEDIKKLTDECECEKTQSLCACNGGGEGASCSPISCYIGTNSNPCPNFEDIKTNQQKIIAWKDEILYYKNRALAEAKDLEDNIKILEAQVDWYDKKIAAEEDVLAQIGGEDKTQKSLIDALKEKKDWLAYEINYKRDLAQKLNGLADAIIKVEKPVNELSGLPDVCLSNIGEKCQASCKGECHDIKDGCQPDKCSGGNPCPTSDIQSKIGEINPLPNEIILICDQIIFAVNSIKKIK